MKGSYSGFSRLPSYSSRLKARGSLADPEWTGLNLKGCVHDQVRSLNLKRIF